MIATRDHAARLSPGPGHHLLDIGSGIGGPARYLASTFGCRVTGVDLTQGFVDAAVERAALCDLSSLVDFVHADAARLPFPDQTFDHAICFYVGMNLPDKPAVLTEAARVLRPGGRLIWTEVVTGRAAPHYPLPWAITAETSHLTDRDALCAMVQAAEFDILDATDETALIIELAKELRQPGQSPSPLQHEANSVVLGPDFVMRRVNHVRNLAEGRIGSLFIDAARRA